MDYGFPIYVVRIKPERKCVGFRLLLGLLFGDCPNVVGLNQCIEREFGQCLVLFYIHFHYRIYFNGFQYEIRF